MHYHVVIGNNTNVVCFITIYSGEYIVTHRSQMITIQCFSEVLLNFPAPELLSDQQIVFPWYFAL